MNEARMTKKRGPFGAVLAAALACGLALCCLGCENALATEAASLQAKASSPVIGLSDASSSAVSSGGVLTFADTAAGNTRSLVVKVENSGKADLAIGGSGVEIAMSSGTEAGSFSILSQPVSSIPPGGSSTFTLDFTPASLGDKSATVVIPSNDVSTPSFSFTIKGSCVLGNKDITAFGFVSPSVTGIISGASIGVNVPSGTNRALLVATFATTGASVSVNGVEQTSGVTTVDFSSGSVDYVVKAADATTKTYTVTVTVAAVVPTVTTAAVGSVAWATASCGGDVTSDGGANVMARGICWDTSNNPTTANSKTPSATNGTGSFSDCSLAGLLPGTYYYVRAYAVNSAGTGYGPSVSFKTSDATSPTTAPVTAINATSATGGCTATPDTGVSVKECGVCWGTSSGPTTAGSYAAGTSGASIAVSGLSLATTYYIRSYAILYSASVSNTVTVYGAEKSFKTVGYPGPSGGYVFYDAGVTIADAGYGDWRYLEAAPSDLGPSVWGDDTDTKISGAIVTKTELGSGPADTDYLRSFTTTGTAAKACYNLVLGGYSDWFMPSRDELNLMIANLSPHSLGSFQDWYYWSSSEATTYAAYDQRGIVTGSSHLKTIDNRYTRAIRRY